MKTGFTLIELLVVVLIIGILSAIALPQYETAVEKARLSEALINGRKLVQAQQMYELAHGEYSGWSREDLDIDLSGGKWDEGNSSYFFTKHFAYRIEDGDFVDIYRLNNPPAGWTNNSASWSDDEVLYYLFLPSHTAAYDGDICNTMGTKIGEKICSSLVSQGFTKED